MTNLIEIKDLTKTYSSKTVVEKVNLAFPTGSFTAIVGESGGGKTTLLRMISGLESATSGQVTEHGNVLETVSKTTRIMFQNGRLLPWKNVLNNILLGSQNSTKERTLDLLDAVGLKDKADVFPVSLSGGERQRVALARALISQPELLLLDEPLGALDALTRLNMQKLIESIWKKYGFTAILVTHDVEEAVRLADRVVVVHDHQVSQPIDLTDLPRPRKLNDSALQKNVELILDQIMQQ
ncbi:ATP-binding cassette domain-containing protein [Oenococcus sp.]|uniref:ATP-binding cassette domain-containing protein n=1 Tax=Oenococcus sp. TaxID=1979414 RepID=UPI0039E933F2